MWVKLYNAICMNKDTYATHMTHSLWDPRKPIGIYPDFAHRKPCSLSILSVSASLFSHSLLSLNTEYGVQWRIVLIVTLIAFA